MKYNVLNGKIVEKGIKRQEIYKELGISEKSFRNKLNGKSDFTWTQVCLIQEKFFPELDKETLFA